MSELRYTFGRNWGEFVEKNLSESDIDASARRLSEMLRISSLAGKRFLDIGCGSGLHSLAALRLGAEEVVSFDYDALSVTTSMGLRARSGFSDQQWRIFQGSILDSDMIAGLGSFDVVYSWGVLHHTGQMWPAVRNAMGPLAPGGSFYIALYASDIYVDPSPDYWIRLKRAYNHANPMTRTLMELQYANWRIIGAGGLEAIASYNARGMHWRTDVKDWLGGYPIEFASYRETCDFCRKEGGLDLVNVAAGEGCTEYVFARLAEAPAWRTIDSTRLRIPVTGRVQPHGGLAWSFPVPHLRSAADSESDHRRSRLMMFENGEPLGLAHALHADIIRHGGGRFSHWGDTVLFSASDGSNPMRNGRTYSYCEAY
jgi:2-polyprenyl-3-methyl-5-hydroxy-6-metoxy-1,4-benzoquinol methylase